MEKWKNLYDFLLESGELFFGMTGNWEKDGKKFCEIQEKLNNIIDEEEYID